MPLPQPLPSEQNKRCSLWLTLGIIAWSSSPLRRAMRVGLSLPWRHARIQATCGGVVYSIVPANEDDYHTSFDHPRGVAWLEHGVALADGGSGQLSSSVADGVQLVQPGCDDVAAAGRSCAFAIDRRNGRSSGALLRPVRRRLCNIAGCSSPSSRQRFQCHREAAAGACARLRTNPGQRHRSPLVPTGLPCRCSTSIPHGV